MLFDLLPEFLILLHAYLNARIELYYATEIHLLGEQRLDVGVKGLPVGVLEVIPFSH